MIRIKKSAALASALILSSTNAIGQNLYGLQNITRISDPVDFFATTVHASTTIAGLGTRNVSNEYSLNGHSEGSLLYSPIEIPKPSSDEYINSTTFLYDDVATFGSFSFSTTGGPEVGAALSGGGYSHLLNGTANFNNIEASSLLSYAFGPIGIVNRDTPRGGSFSLPIQRQPSRGFGGRFVGLSSNPSVHEVEYVAPRFELTSRAGGNSRNAVSTIEASVTVAGNLSFRQKVSKRLVEVEVPDYEPNDIRLLSTPELMDLIRLKSTPIPGGNPGGPEQTVLDMADATAANAEFARRVRVGLSLSKIPASIVPNALAKSRLLSAIGLGQAGAAEFEAFNKILELSYREAFDFETKPFQLRGEDSPEVSLLRNFQSVTSDTALRTDLKDLEPVETIWRLDTPEGIDDPRIAYDLSFGYTSQRQSIAYLHATIPTLDRLLEAMKLGDTEAIALQADYLEVLFSESDYHLDIALDHIGRGHDKLLSDTFIYDQNEDFEPLKLLSSIEDILGLSSPRSILSTPVPEPSSLALVMLASGYLLRRPRFNSRATSDNTTKFTISPL